MRTLTVLLIFLPLFVTAQQSDYQKRFQAGKVLFRNGQYALAIEMFGPATAKKPSNPYKEYASYYFGLSAFRLADYQKASNMFSQIARLYPDWKEIGHVYFWMAATHFRQQQHAKAMQALNKLNRRNASGSLLDEAEELKRFYLYQLKDVKKLEGLLRNNGSDTLVAKALAFGIARKSPEEQEKRRLVEIIDRYKLDGEEFGVISADMSVKKDQYNVALVLPFLYDQLSTEQRRQGNQFVIDLYQGIRLAVEDLRKENISIELQAYDSKRDADHTLRILNSEKMQTADLIIGPLFPETSPLVSRFAFDNKINNFNPLSSNSAIVEDNEFAFLSYPALERQARKAADFTTEELDEQFATIFYGTSNQDSILAYSYREQFLSKPNRRVMLMRGFTSAGANEMMDILEKRDSTLTDSTQRLSHVFVASKDPVMITNAMSAVLAVNDSITLVGMRDLTDIRNVSLNQLEDLEIYWIDPDFVPEENKPALEKFRNRYANRYYAVPSRFALKGYDLMYFIGKQLYENGIYFQKRFAEPTVYPSTFFNGYNYYNSNDNRVVPIVKMKDYRLQPAEISIR